jgi:AcrR family transcriptional regulator
MDNNATSTKHRIAHAALDLFSRKGFTETSIREIAMAVGINVSSLYNHFESKAAMLDHLLEDYKQFACSIQPSNEFWTRLKPGAKPDDVVSCLTIYFPVEKEAYYLKMVSMLFQEQCRNNAIKEFMFKNKILWQEKFISDVLNHLIEIGVLRPDTDVDFWAKTHTNLTYSHMGRYAIGAGETQPQYKGKRFMQMITTMYDTIFKLHGNNPEAEPLCL